MSKIILDLCGGTGSWSQPYREAGFDVRVITLPHYDVLRTEVVDDEIRFWCPKDNPLRPVMQVDIKNIYGILAAPPCTMFSLARTTAKTPRNFYEGMSVVKACMDIIWATRSHPDSQLKFWALENPMGYLRQFLGKPPLTYHPYEYGDKYMKKTDIWGYYNMPTKKPVELTEQELEIIRRGHGNPSQPIPDWLQRAKINNRLLPQVKGLSVADRRAITPQGFAKAFFKANP